MTTVDLAERSVVQTSKPLGFLVSHARDIAPEWMVDRVRDALSEIGECSFATACDLVGSVVVARFGILALVGRGDATLSVAAPLRADTMIASQSERLL